ncbi:MAG: DNA internalization-related competence protein ComEC/Rec2 [Pseudomonadota bacterium]
MLILMALTTGVVAGSLVPLTVSFLFPLKGLGVSLGLIVLIGLAFQKFGNGYVKKEYQDMLLACFIFLLSSLLAMMLTSYRIHERLVHRLPESMAKSVIMVEGWIDDLPRITEYGTRFSFQVTRVENETLAVAALPERLWLTAYLPTKPSEETKWRPQAGECWKLAVSLKPPHGLMNPHGFDTETWMLSHGFDASGSLKNRVPPVYIERCARTVFESQFQWLQKQRQILKNKLERLLGQAPYTGVLTALTIGDQPAIPETQWHRFNATGIGHLISISGFHISFLAGLAAWIVSKLIIWSPRCLDIAPDRVWGASAGVIVAVAYVLLAGGGVPAQRTAWMISMMALGWAVGRRLSGSVVFSWAMIGVLFMDSFAPLTAGFWLSFIGVGSLMLSGNGLVVALTFWREAFKSQMVATVALLPATLYLFGKVSVVSPFANALAIPVVSILVTPLALFGVLIPNESIALFALNASHRIFEWLDIVLAWLSNNPFISAIWQGAQPSLWSTVWATVGIIGYACGAKALPGRLWISCLSILSLMALPQLPVVYGAARLTVLDVGQGLSVLIETANHRLLYDSGPRPFKASASSGADAGARVILPFLRGEGINSIDTLMISHQDTDHRGGADTLLEQLPINKLLTSVKPDLFKTRKDKTVFEYCQTGQHWEWDGVKFLMLSPTLERLAHEARTNDLSCVLKIATAEVSVLLPGDAEGSVENELLETQKAALPSTLLIAGHHGSRSSTSVAWLEQVQPRYTIFTTGYLNHYHHPHPSILERVAQHGSMSLRSDQHGSIKFEVSEKIAAVTLPECWRYQVRRVWHYGVEGQEIPPSKTQVICR